MRYQYMSVATNLDTCSLVFCGEFEAPINSRGFLKSVIKAHNEDAIFLLEGVSASKLKLKMIELNDINFNTTLKVYFGNLFMGYVSLEDMALASSELLNYMDEVKNDKK